MAKFNFYKYQSKNVKNVKDQSDEHTEFRLRKDHVEAPEAITEKQLDRDRIKEKEVIIEKLLDGKRTGSAEVIIEKNLSDGNEIFGSKFRNSEAYDGDINKLEEKRLSGKNTEDEKYEASSETLKKMRWWDALKKSSSDKVIKTAVIDPDNAESELEFDPSDPKRFERLRGLLGTEPEPEEGLVPDTSTIQSPSSLSEKMEEDNTEEQKMFVTKNSEGATPIPHLYMQFSYDPNDFNGDIQAIKDAAMEKALSIRPQLAGKITTKDFADPKFDEDTISLRLIGDEYFKSEPEPEVAEATSELFLGSESDEIDVGGTPMITGKLTVDPLMAETMEDDVLIQAAIDYIGEKEGYEIPAEALNVNLSKGEITFSYSLSEEDITSSGPEGETKTPAEIVNELKEQEMEEEADQLMEEGLDSPIEEDLTNEDFAVSETLPSSDVVTPAVPTKPITETTSPKNPEELSEEEKEKLRQLEPSMAKNIYNFPITIADSKKN